MTSKHKITYTIYEGKIITGHNPLMPIVRCYSDSMAYGDLEFPITETQTDEVSSLECQIYACSSPDISETRWIKTGDDLYSASVMNFSGLLVGRNSYKITYKFLPGSLSPSNGDYYSLEFYLTLDQTIPAIYSPKLIVNIKDRVTF